MSLSKQLYILITIIFFMIFMGNFIISVQNTKEYLVSESVTKAQDTATSLGLTLQGLMKNKNDSEIDSTIKAVSNRGFYKEIRLEDIGFTFSDVQLMEKSKDTDDLYWKITNVHIDAKYGELSSSAEDLNLANELSTLENETQDAFGEQEEIVDTVYLLAASPNLKENDPISINFTASKEGQTVQSNVEFIYTRVLAQDTREVKFDTVPQWFINMIPIDLDETQSEISDGWKTTATLYVSANPGVAYEKLYEQAKGAILYALIAFLISIVFTIVFLQFILKPLRDIEKLAHKISNGHFETIKKLPWTKELRSVSLAMNDMSGKIEGMIQKLNINLEKMSEKLSTDELTGLSIKQTFETDMKNMFIGKETGYILSVKVDNLQNFAKENDSNTVDNFLKDFSKILNGCDKSAMAYRFFGSEFALIVKNCNHEQVSTIIKKLQNDLDLFGEKVHKSNVAHIGASVFNPYGTTQGILERANEAFETAKQVGPNEACIRDDEDAAKDMQQWKELVFDIIEHKNFNVDYVSDACTLDAQNKLVMQEAFTQAQDKQGNNIPIGTFISIAEKYDKIIDFDKAVVKKVINHILTSKITHDISINLSLESIANIEFRHWLAHEIRLHHTIAPQLVFSVTSYGVAKNVEQFKMFIEMIHNVESKIIIKRFETKFIPLNTINEFNLDYIRLARDYTMGVSKDNTKYGFIESMQDLAVLLNIKVFAENVKEDSDVKIIKELGLYGTSR
ncbi:MAG: EAL domain-containing protein [Campylobacterota bacterium]|nr:EAL domain-containing protein [Campylobacterota bacterium]